MTRLLARLLLVLTVLLMPFGMAAPAAANAPHSAMAMPACPGDSPTQDHSKGAGAECTMACSAALPAVETVAALPADLAPVAIAPVLVGTLSGLHPETATPPPKAS